MAIHKILMTTALGLVLPLLVTAAPFGNEADLADAKKVWSVSQDAWFC